MDHVEDDRTEGAKLGSGDEDESEGVHISSSEDDTTEGVQQLDAAQTPVFVIDIERERSVPLIETEDVDHRPKSGTDVSTNQDEVDQDPVRNAKLQEISNQTDTQDIDATTESRREQKTPTESRQEKKTLVVSVDKKGSQSNSSKPSLESYVEELVTRLIRPMNPPKKQRDPTKVEPDPPSPDSAVVYKLRYKNSKLDAHWKSKTFNETEYERLTVEGSNSVLEMRKDAHLNEEAKESKDLRIASIVGEEMTIHSQYLIAIMPEVVGYYPSSKSSGWKVRGGLPSLTVHKPYRMLGGARPNLKDLREKYTKEINDSKCNEGEELIEIERKETTIKHIEYLEHELDKVLKDPMREEEIGYRQDHPVASFDMLWLLFRPGELVYTKINDNLVCCRVINPFWDILKSGATVDSPTRITLELQMWFLDFNGTHVDRRKHNLRIDSFEGKRKILELEAYPIKYSKDQILRETMIDQDKKYMQFLQQKAPQCQYKGFVFRRQESSKEMKERHFYEGKVVVDPVFHYIEYGPPYGSTSWQDKTDIWPSETSDGSMTKFVNINPNDSDLQLEDEHYMLLTCYIRGFTLGTRKWVWFHIDFLTEYQQNEHLIDGLEIDLELLTIVKSFVPRLDAHQRGDAPQEQPLRVDPIEGKGEGQIMLFHGPPGTGKTFTAECLAEYSGRPLLRLSCSELGIDPTLLEQKLWKWFRMAEEWQGVLLIDEADVYLQQRFNGQSLEQETIVAVFLRALEYYRGILFLTSNCVRKFDEAVTSRVSLVVPFQNLAAHERKNLRLKYQKEIEWDDQNRYVLYGDAIAALEDIDHSPYTYNGREIKNVFHIALALATEDAKHRTEKTTDDSREKTNADEKINLKCHHVRSVMKNVEKFIDYQRGEVGKDREKLAQDGLRRF